MKLIELLQRRNNFSASEGKESQIIERVLKGNTVTVKPTSSRFFSRGSDNRYESGNVDIDNNGGVKVGKPSTAIQSVSYDPSTEICSVVFRNGDGKAYDYSMTPSEFEDFMRSDSKGRYVNSVMKYQNHI